MNNSNNYLYGDANGVGIVGAGNNFRVKTNNLERLRIIQNGNVGIGVTGPTSALSINKSMAAAFIADFINPAVNGHGLLIQAGGTTGTRYITQWKDELAQVIIYFSMM